MPVVLGFPVFNFNRYLVAVSIHYQLGGWQIDVFYFSVLFHYQGKTPYKSNKIPKCWRLQKGCSRIRWKAMDSSKNYSVGYAEQLCDSPWFARQGYTLFLHAMVALLSKECVNCYLCVSCLELGKSCQASQHRGTQSFLLILSLKRILFVAQEWIVLYLDVSCNVPLSRGIISLPELQRIVLAADAVLKLCNFLWLILYHNIYSLNVV